MIATTSTPVTPETPATLETPEMSEMPAEQRVLLKNVSWQTFETLLAEIGDNRNTRLTYDRGFLEIMAPLLDHENPKELLTSLVGVLVEELNVEIVRAGSTTLTRQDLARGSEPASSFYIKNEQFVKGKRQIDLKTDPSPDLVIEIDITSSSIDKSDLYANMGVPELWRYNGRKLQFLQLQDKNYIAIDFSINFPFLSVAEVTKFLVESKTVGETTLLRSLRAWVRTQIEAGDE